MPRILFYTTLILFSAVLSSCNSQPTTAPSSSGQLRYAATTTKDVYFKPAAGETIAWYGRGIFWSTDNPTARDEALANLMAREIQNHLQSKGYQFTKYPQQANYLLGVAITDNRSSSSEAMKHFFSVAPGLSQSEQDHSATVVLALARNTEGVLARNKVAIRNNLLFRSALEAFVLDDIDYDQRTERVKAAAGVLANELPALLN